MKFSIKGILTICIVVFSTAVASAQQDKVKFGVKGGLNMSYLNVNSVLDENFRVGYHIGVASEIPVNEMVSIQPEILYSTKGVKGDISLLGLNASSTFKLNYIDVPVMLKLNFAEFFDVHIGPYASYLISSDISTSGDLGSYEFNINENDLEEWDFGLGAGAGVHLDNLELGVRYNQGLRQVGKSTASSLILGDAKNSVIQIYAAIGL